MRDLKPVEELSDARLAELSAKARQNTDLEAAKDAVFDLEIKLREAQSSHRRRFPQGSTDAAVSESTVKINRLTEELHWSRRDLEARQNTPIHSPRVKPARKTHTFLKPDFFEVRDAHGRVIRHRAASADTLRRELTAGYTIVAEVFGFAADGTGGISVSTDPDVPTLLDGILAAFGPELLAWLSSQGVQIRRDA